MMNTRGSKTYSEMVKYDSFDERYEYLKLGGTVGYSTFGYDRYMNQMFYTSKQWKDLRQHILLRDNGCDLGAPDHEIRSKPIVHHMNPMTADDIKHGESWILDPEYLITTTHITHLAIHYGDKGMLPRQFIARSPGDTRLW
jgi:hypothetical protein